jgi:hypothetical protein
MAALKKEPPIPQRPKYPKKILSETVKPAKTAQAGRP